MKNLFLLIFIALGTVASSQEVRVTPDGIRDANSIDKAYVVLDAEGFSAKQLYDNALAFVIKNYKSPDDVVQGKIDGQYLRFTTHVDKFLKVKNSWAKIAIDADYTIELHFKDGRAKYEITELDMYAENGGHKVLFTGGSFAGYPIYSKKGELKRSDTKNEIEAYFNAQISSLRNFLRRDNDGDQW